MVFAHLKKSKIYIFNNIKISPIYIHIYIYIFFQNYIIYTEIYHTAKKKKKKKKKKK